MSHSEGDFSPPSYLDSPALTAEARQLLRAVDQGGVPTVASDRLLRIGRENGVDVTSEMTPNEIIEAIRQRAR